MILLCIFVQVMLTTHLLIAKIVNFFFVSPVLCVLQVEEKMRILHERKSKKLKRLDERGAEAHKIDATRTLVRSLSTKIRIAIQVVDKISVKINTLRDEELWPQLNEFIQGYAFLRMAPNFKLNVLSLLVYFLNNLVFLTLVASSFYLIYASFT